MAETLSSFVDSNLTFAPNSTSASAKLRTKSWNAPLTALSGAAFPLTFKVEASPFNSKTRFS